MRLVVRTMRHPEPKAPYSTDGLGVATSGGTGQGALGNIIGGGGSSEGRSWKWLGRHYANACANSPQNILRGHASTLKSTLWNGLGASRAEPRRFRDYMDKVKWWYIMAQTHNGGFVVMPGHDYASTDHVYGTRVFPSATAALILSVKDRHLRITGADPSGMGDSPSSSVAQKRTTPKPRVVKKVPRMTRPKPLSTRWLGDPNLREVRLLLRLGHEDAFRRAAEQTSN